MVTKAPLHVKHLYVQHMPLKNKVSLIWQIPILYETKFNSDLNAIYLHHLRETVHFNVPLESPDSLADSKVPHRYASVISL